MKKTFFLSAIIISLGLIVFYFIFAFGWLEFRNNTDTPSEFMNQSNISLDAYSKDKTQLVNQFKHLVDNHVEFFYSAEYFEGTEIIIDTILYSPEFDKLVILIMTKNPTSRQLRPYENEPWYYNATIYLGVRKEDSIDLSWLGPNFTNSIDKSELSKMLRNKSFRTFVTKDTVGEYAHKYNLNDIRFWSSKVWQRTDFENE